MGDEVGRVGPQGRGAMGASAAQAEGRGYYRGPRFHGDVEGWGTVGETVGLLSGQTCRH